MTKEEVGIIIKNRRIELGLTQIQLAKKLGLVTHHNIIAVEKGRRGLSFDSLNKICEALDLELAITNKNREKND